MGNAKLMIILSSLIIKRIDALVVSNDLGTKSDELIDFCAANGKRFLTLSTLENNNTGIQDAMHNLLERSKRRTKIYSRLLFPSILDGEQASEFPAREIQMGGKIVPLEKELDPRRSLDFHKDALVIFASASDSKSWMSYMKWIANHLKVGASILVLVGDVDTKAFEVLKQSLGDLKKSSFFYLAYTDPDSHGIKWQQIISLNHFQNVVSNPIKINSVNGIIIEEYDFQGMMVFGQATNWAPFRKLSESCNTCKKLTRCPQCRPDGYLIDIVREFGRIQNFSWECHLEPNSNLGTKPISGPADQHGVWGGVIGNVFGGDYHFSAGVYNNRLERHDMFDMVPILHDSTILIVRPTPLDMDLGLLIRPYRKEAWALVAGVVVAIFGLLLIPFLFISEYSKYTSFRMINAIGWGAFLLLEVFYSGALTMFFSTELSLPFETILDVMRAYPDYKLITQTNNQVYFIYKVQDGDPDYVAFWDRFQNKPEETIFKKTQDALMRMETERVVPLFQGGSLKGYAKNNPGVLNKFSLKVFGEGRTEYMNLILNKNSPLYPAWKQASLRIMESGIGSKFDKLWLGELKSSSSIEDTLTVLKPTHLVLVFFIVSCSIILCSAVWVIEKTWFQMNKGNFF